ncbi:MAG: hypothetical protein ACLPT6_11750 [Desulfobaccales bacterium]
MVISLYFWFSEPRRPVPARKFRQGRWGREALVYILGPTFRAMAEKALALKYALQAGGKL